MEARRASNPHQTRNQSEAAAPIPASLAGRPGQRFSDARRAEHPEAVRIRDPRAIELAGALAEIAGCGNGATENDLSMLGFSIGEIIAHLPEAKLILAESFVREIAPTGDRLQQIIEKALASAAHIMPKTAGLDEASEEAAAVEWRRYCRHAPPSSSIPGGRNPNAPGFAESLPAPPAAARARGQPRHLRHRRRTEGDRASR
jgi:hypothetical protein